MRSTLNTIIICVTVCALSALIGHAGDLEPPAGPVQPTMKNLDAIEPSKTITALPFTIFESGSYTLCSDLTGVDGEDGIVITASDVTLDLRGFTLKGIPGSGSGIVAPEDTSGITIKNGNVNDWEGSGIDLSTCLKARLVDVNACSNGVDGIAVRTGIIERCSARANGNNGITCTDRTIVSRCRAINNIENGIDGGSFVVVRECICTGNGNIGIVVFQRGNVADCEASSNGLAGISLTFAGIVKNCTADFNDWGILLSDPGGACLALENACTNNSEYGIQVFGDANRVEGNLCVGNNIGMQVLGTGNLLVGNSCLSNNGGYVIQTGNHYGQINANPGASFSIPNAWSNF